MRFLILSVALLVASQPTLAADPTSDTDKAVRFTEALEKDPLGSDAAEMRRWLITWVTETPDFVVNVCQILGPLPSDEIPYSGELIGQQIFGNVSYQIRNPGKKDELLFQLAGVESALKAYQKILAKDPKVRMEYFDDLLESQRRSRLKEQIAPQVAKMCTKDTEV